jgi:small ligand-binding sensory domain FIST
VPFVAALSQHPVVATAVGEVSGRVLEHLGPAPDLAVLFVGAAGTGALEDVVGAVRALVRPVVLVGCTAASVIADEVDGGESAVALWAGADFDATATRGVADHAAFVLADPFSHRTGQAGLGFASGGRGIGGNRLLIDHEVFTDGAVSVTLDGIETTSRTVRRDELHDTLRVPADAALVFAGNGSAVALSETVGGAPLAGMRAAHADPDTSTLVLFRH